MEWSNSVSGSIVSQPLARQVTNVTEQSSSTFPESKKAKRALTLPHVILSENHEPVSDAYVANVSSELTFSEDVVRDRCFHMLPYSNKYLYEALDISDIVSTLPTHSNVPQGRHNMRGPDLRHSICHLKQTPRKNSANIAKSKHHANVKNHGLVPSEKNNKEPSKIITGEVLKEEKLSAVNGSKTAEHGWDEYLLSVLSLPTAKWLVKKCVPPNEHKLQAIVERRLDLLPPMPIHVDNEEEMQFKNKAKQKKWQRPDDNFLLRVRQKTASESNYEQSNSALQRDKSMAFYRLPATMRREVKYEQKLKEAVTKAVERTGASNRTAQRVTVEPFINQPPKSLRQFLNPAVGTKILSTDNQYEQDMLMGNQPIYLDNTVVKLKNGSLYKKVVQKDLPKQPYHWLPSSDSDNKLDKPAQGVLKWIEKPQLIYEQQLNAPEGNDKPSFANEADSDENTNKTGNISLLSQIAQEWRLKWSLDMRYTDATVEDLIRDMADTQVQVRLIAITTCTRAAEYRNVSEDVVKGKEVSLLPEDLFTALDCCLDDTNKNVKLAAAIALYALERPNDRAEAILHQEVQDERSPDRYTAAQCLAYYGECNSVIVKQLVTQLFMNENNLEHEKLLHLLKILSEKSILVHAMIAEQLNSSSWSHRLTACKLLPQLHGHISKDLVNKLINIMWNDWHMEVRKVAAQSLGKTGHGKEVHDELRMKMLEGSERQRVEAISKVGYLGIMTAKLLSAFLLCFEDSYISVRAETCISCGHLRIKEEIVLEKLVQLIKFDPIWRVKALAIQALNKIGEMTPAIRQCILWALQYEKEEAVRVEACQCVVQHMIHEQDIVQILQDHVNTERSALVLQELRSALVKHGIALKEDELVTKMKAEMKLRSKQNVIFDDIQQSDAVDFKQATIKRLIYHEDTEEVNENDVTGEPIHHKNDVLDITFDAASRPTTHATGLSTPTADREVAAILLADKGGPTPSTTAGSVRSNWRVESSELSKDNSITDDHQQQQQQPPDTETSTPT